MYEYVMHAHALIITQVFATHCPPWLSGYMVANHAHVACVACNFADVLLNNDNHFRVTPVMWRWNGGDAAHMPVVSQGRAGSSNH